ncbi:MAG: hypothetical protein JST96_13285 [Bacteroidetes bacterium]|nr:hypothetical protein [Bacteroidota bacterium]
MKRLFLQCSYIAVIAIFVANNAQAQDTLFKKLPTITVFSGTKVTNEVSKAFHSTFPDAENAIWYKADKNYLVRFISKDQTNRALFEKSGMLIYHIQYGNEANLPDDIHKLVKSKYSAYDITMVIYVNQEDRKIWVINVEDSKKLIVLRSEEGELEKMDTYNKM